MSIPEIDTWELAGFPGRLNVAAYLTTDQAAAQYRVLVDVLFDAQEHSLTGVSRDELLAGVRERVAAATDQPTADRLTSPDVGVGAGWSREEMANHGTGPRRRMALLRERVEAMKAIWTSDEASYAGEYVAFERIWSWPKPAQRPYPPVLVGGNVPGVLDQVLASG